MIPIFIESCLFLLIREPITEYGRVYVQYRSKTADTRWYRTISYSRVDIDGNPNHPLNGGITGLAAVHCLASLANHSEKHRNACFEEPEFSSKQALEEDTGNGFTYSHCSILFASRDIQKNEQIFVNYEPQTARAISEEGPLIPFDNMSLGELMAIGWSILLRQY
jgi:hypothetical protein